MCTVTTPGDEKITLAPHVNLAKDTQKRSYVLVVASKPTQALEHPCTHVMYKNRKQQATKPNVKSKDQEKRIIFSQVLGQQKSKADLCIHSLPEAFSPPS